MAQVEHFSRHEGGDFCETSGSFAEFAVDVQFKHARWHVLKVNLSIGRVVDGHGEQVRVVGLSCGMDLSVNHNSFWQHHWSVYSNVDVMGTVGCGVEQLDGVLTAGQPTIRVVKHRPCEGIKRPSFT